MEDCEYDVPVASTMDEDNDWQQLLWLQLRAVHVQVQTVFGSKHSWTDNIKCNLWNHTQGLLHDLSTTPIRTPECNCCFDDFVVHSLLSNFLLFIS